MIAQDMIFLWEDFLVELSQTEFLMHVSTNMHFCCRQDIYIFFFNLISFLQFVFEGVIGKSYKGDIGLDDISVNDGQCPPTGRIYAEITNHKII